MDEGQGVGRGEGPTRQLKEGEGKVCKGEGDAFKAGRDNIDSVTMVVVEGRAKVVSAVPVWIPRETVVGAVKGKTKLTGGDGEGGRRSRREHGGVPTKQRERGVGAPGEHEVKVEFGVGEKAVPEVSREIGVGGGEDGDEVIFAGPH